MYSRHVDEKIAQCFITRQVVSSWKLQEKKSRSNSSCIVYFDYIFQLSILLLLVTRHGRLLQGRKTKYFWEFVIRFSSLRHATFDIWFNSFVLSSAAKPEQPEVSHLSCNNTNRIFVDSSLFMLCDLRHLIFSCVFAKHNERLGKVEGSITKRVRRRAEPHCWLTTWLIEDCEFFLSCFSKFGYFTFAFAFALLFFSLKQRHFPRRFRFVFTLFPSRVPRDSHCRRTHNKKKYLPLPRCCRCRS